MMLSRTIRNTIALDVRAIALFRILFGAVVVIDTIRRLLDVTAFYTNHGVWSSHFALYAAGSGAPPFSIMYAVNSTPEACFFFGFQIILAVLFSLGISLRVVHPLLFLFMMSAMNRNPHLIYGGDTVQIIFLTIAFFLPLDRAYAVGKPSHSGTVASVGTLLILFQLSCIYLFNGLHKTGASWSEGTVTYYLLHHEKVVTSFGLFIRDYLPLAAHKVMAWGTLIIEKAAPLILFSPIMPRFCKGLAVLLYVGLHVGIGSFAHLGVFSYAMTAILVCLLPPGVLDRIEAKLGRRSAPLDIKATTIVQNFFAALFLVYAVLAVLNFNKILDGKVPPIFREEIFSIARYTGWYESWGMYSPDINRDNGRVIIDVELEDGTHKDAVTGLPPDFSTVNPKDYRWTALLDLYYSRLIDPNHGALRDELAAWIYGRRRGLGLSPSDKPKRFSVWLLRQRISPPGSSIIQPRINSLIFER